jgi:hypothetical protein
VEGVALSVPSGEQLNLLKIDLSNAGQLSFISNSKTITNIPVSFFALKKVLDANPSAVDVLIRAICDVVFEPGFNWRNAIHVILDSSNIAVIRQALNRPDSGVVLKLVDAALGNSKNLWIGGNLRKEVLRLELYSRVDCSMKFTNVPILGNVSANLTFDGTNLTVGGSDTATRFIPSGSTVATNGMYLPAADTLGFSTASTERMRIDSAGNVGIGGTAPAGTNLLIAKNLTGSVTAQAIRISGQLIQSDVTSEARGVISLLGTAASSFTLGSLQHFYAAQGTFGAGSTVTNQFGFLAASSLTGATNNFGFRGQIASGTGRYNLYMDGTAENFLGGNTVISVTDNTNAALRITQLGTGNAILVEDAANPDSTPFVINAAGQVSTGFTSNPATMFGTVPQLGVHTTGNDGLANYRAGNDVNGASFVFQKTRGADPSVNTIVQSGDTLGGIYWTGADGTSYLRAAQILGQVDSPAPGTNDMPGRLVFSTTADGASSPTERLRIASTGAFGLSGANYGTSGQVLTSGGSGAAPTWTTVSGGGSAATPTALGTVYGNTPSAGITSANLGYQAGASTTGDRNVIVGYQAHINGVTSSTVTAIGYQAIGGAGTNVQRATAVGFQSLYSHAGSGSNFANTAVGWQSLYALTAGDHCTAVGHQAGTAITTATGNTFIGSSSGAVTTTGSNNTAIGYVSLASNTTGAENVALGGGVLATNSTGLYNTGAGLNALNANTTGSYNSAFGRGALQSNTTASYNTAFGFYALLANTTGADNVAIGSGSQFDTNTGALGANTTGTENVAIGAAALSSNTTARMNIAIGNRVMRSNTTGSYNVAIGGHLDGTTGFKGALGANTTGAQNTAVGTGALAKNTTGNYNVAVGLSALQENTTSSNNTAVGFEALKANTTNGFNTVVGYQAALVNTTGSQHCVLGTLALSNNTTGSTNTAIGNYALVNCTTGVANIQIGALNSAQSNASVFNVTTESNRLVMGHTGITNAYVQVAWTVVSDARDKTNFAPVPHGLDFVTQLNPVQYQFRTDRQSEETNGSVRYGFKAQEVLALEGANPVIIDNEDSEKLRMTDTYMIPILVKAIQELKAEFDAYKATHP